MEEYYTDMAGYEIRDDQWGQIKDFLPPERKRPVVWLFLPGPSVTDLHSSCSLLTPFRLLSRCCHFGRSSFGKISAMPAAPIPKMSSIN